MDIEVTSSWNLVLAELPPWRLSWSLRNSCIDVETRQMGRGRDWNVWHRVWNSGSVENFWVWVCCSRQKNSGACNIATYAYFHSLKVFRSKIKNVLSSQVNPTSTGKIWRYQNDWTISNSGELGRFSICRNKITAGFVPITRIAVGKYINHIRIRNLSLRMKQKKITRPMPSALDLYALNPKLQLKDQCDETLQTPTSITFSTLTLS